MRYHNRGTTLFHCYGSGLRQALSDRSGFGSNFVRREAAQALGRIGPKAAGVAVNDLLPLLGDDDFYVRRAASEALALLHTNAIPGLIKSLEHPKPEVELKKDDDFAFEIVVLLSRTAAREKVLPKLLEALDDAPPPIVRSQLVRSIGMAGPSAVNAIPVIQKALHDSQTGFRAAEALFGMTPHDDNVKRQIDEYCSRHKLDSPYPGYSDDLRLAKRKMEYEGPAATFFAPEAVWAAARLFGHVPFVGKTKPDVVKVLGGITPTSARDDGDPRALIYRFDTGWGGMQYELTFKDGKVQSVKTNGLY